MSFETKKTWNNESDVDKKPTPEQLDLSNFMHCYFEHTIKPKLGEPELLKLPPQVNSGEKFEDILSECMKSIKSDK